VDGAEYILLVGKGVKSPMKTLVKARAAETLQLDIAASGSLDGRQEVSKGGDDDDIGETLLGMGGFLQRDHIVVSKIGAKATPSGCMDIILRY
jgi:hypothetical protein